MKKSIKITIANPCHEDWTKMTPTEKGKHCNSCEKEVIDFSEKSDEEIFKLVRSGASMCGRFKNTQLDRDIALSYLPAGMARKRNNSLAQYAASLLIPAAILSTQDMKAQQTEAPTSQVQKRYTSLGIGTHPQSFKKRFDPFAFDTVGIVYANGYPVAGAQVSIKDSNRSLVTNSKGSFSLEALPGEILIIQLKGFDTQEIAIDENAPKYKVQMGNGIVSGQRFIVSGTISDQSGVLPGANVTVKGKARGIATDFDGNYTIEVEHEDILVFSYVGYDTQEVAISSNLDMSDPLNIDLDISLDGMILGEIITTGIVIVAEADDTSLHTPTFNTATTEQKQAIEERRDHQEKVNAWKRFKNALKRKASQKKD